MFQAVFHALRLTPNAPPAGPAFPSGPAPRAPPISPSGFTSLVMAALRWAGVDTTGLGSYSFRRGGASFLWSTVGIDEGRIRELADWASTAYTIYAVSDESGLRKTTAVMVAALPAPFEHGPYYCLLSYLCGVGEWSMLTAPIIRTWIILPYLILCLSCARLDYLTLLVCCFIALIMRALFLWLCKPATRALVSVSSLK